MSADARVLKALAAMGAPVSLAVALCFGIWWMGWGGCTHMSPFLIPLSGGLTVFLVGLLAASLTTTQWRARRTRRLALQASDAITDTALLDRLDCLAARVGVRTPQLRLIDSPQPIALSVSGPRPLIVVSSWTLAALSEAEWQALLAHELAHLRRLDRWVRWLGSWLLSATWRLPTFHLAWGRLEDASEQAADELAQTVLDQPGALATARTTFLQARSDTAAAPIIASAVIAWPTSYRLALLALGCVLALPLVPLVVVPACLSLCNP